MPDWDAVPPLDSFGDAVKDHQALQSVWWPSGHRSTLGHLPTRPVGTLNLRAGALTERWHTD